MTASCGRRAGALAQLCHREPKGDAMIRTTTTSGSGALARASLRETCAVLADVIAPTLAKGVIIRRPGMVALAARLDLDRRAIRRMQSLRDKYRVGPLLLPIP